MEPSRSNDDPSGTPSKNPAAPRRRGMWSQARQLAERTPETRNRYVDFLRGLSIGAVVFGHWLMAAPYFAGGKAHMAHLLAVVPWSQWLTWIFQVMPIFFFVGGYANMTSWQAARRRGQGYNFWLGSRLQRLLGPVLPLLCTWMALAWAGHLLGIPRGFIQVGSRIALVPTWFLAVYIMVVLFVPFTYGAWKRLGLWTIAIPIVCASAVDLLFFWAGWHLAGWLNYLFVWLTVHQLGYAWRERRLPSSAWIFIGCIIGWFTLLALVFLGPYPLSLVGVPTDRISNTLPPKLPLLALGFAQIGLVMSLERPARRWLQGMMPWTGTVMINGMIMTLFLWHSTAMMLVIGLGFFLWPGVFAVAPGSVTWWLVRPLWVALFAAATVPFLLGFSRFERSGAARLGKPLPVWRLYVGCVSACASLGYLSLRGVGSGVHWIWDGVALALPFVGAACAGFGPLSRISAGRRSR